MTFRLTAINKRRAITFARWALPIVLSAVASVFVTWGSIQYAKGTDAQRLSVAERDITEIKGERDKFVRRDSFQILLDDIREIKADVRAMRDRDARHAAAASGVGE